MNLPIKILGFVNSVFWVLLIVVLVFSAAPVADLGYMIFSPSQTVNAEGDLVLSLPMRVDNTGSSKMANVGVSSVLLDADGLELASDYSSVEFLRAYGNVSVNQSLIYDPKEVFGRSEKYLFENQNLTVKVSVGSSFDGMLSAEVSTNFSYPWGAPFRNFRVLNAEEKRFNSSHSELRVEVKFENCALFSLPGRFKINYYDNQTRLQSALCQVIEVIESPFFTSELRFFIPSEDASFLKAEPFEMEFSDSGYRYFVKEVSF